MKMVKTRVSVDQEHLITSIRRTRRWLAFFRVLQVILGLVATVVTAWSVAVLAIAIKNNSLDQAISSQTDKAVAEDGFRLSQADQNTMVDTVSYTALGVSVALLVISLLSFILSFVWLVRTLSRKRRAHATCFGNHRPCANYTCDICWDVILSLIWGALFALSIVSAVRWNDSMWSARSIVDTAFTGTMMVWYWNTAFLAGCVRRRMQRLIAQEGFITSGPAPVSPETYTQAYMPYGPNAA